MKHSASNVDSLDTPVVDLAIDTFKKNKQALIFVNSKRSAQKAAADVAKEMRLLTAGDTFLQELSEKVLNAVTHPTEQCKKLSFCVRHGIAFHHSGLSGEQRSLIEKAFRSGNLKLIACTPTLAAGLDMPAFRTILKDLRRFSGSWGMQYIPVLEYEQMAGRAGRPGKEDFGEAIAIASTERERQTLIDMYIYGRIEDIYSKLAVEPVLRTYVLSLLSVGFCRTTAELITFFSKTFWAHQYKDLARLEAIIRRVLELLRSYTFIEAAADSDFNSAADLLSQISAPILVTRLGHRVSQLYLDPLSANLIIQGLKKDTMTEFGIVQLLCQTLEMRPLLRAKEKESDLINRLLFSKEKELLVEMPTMYDPDYVDFPDTIKTTAYFLDWINEIGEDVLLEKFDIRPGEVNAKNEIMDWLLYCSAELCGILNQKQHISLLSKLRVRVEYGAKEDLLPLLQLKGVGKVRGRTLVNAGVRTIQDVIKVPLPTLTAAVGQQIALNLKHQVGADQPVEKQSNLDGF